jgi:hypothetical protein
LYWENTIASSTNGLYGSIPFGSTPQDAVTTTLGFKGMKNYTRKFETSIFQKKWIIDG